MTKLCRIAGCGKPHYGHGWCSAHHTRWRRHGDPLGGGTAQGEPTRYLRDVVMAYGDADCMYWPFTRNDHGYGQIRFNGKLEYVHRLVCEELHGQPPSPNHQAAHSCGNGHLGCVNGRHLSWKTPHENAADKLIHGTDGRGERCATAKLTEADVVLIRGLKDSTTQRKIAERFGVSEQTVSKIMRRDRWAWMADACDTALNEALRSIGA